MKKRLAVLAVCGLMFSLISCSSAPGPERQFEAFAAALQQRDANAAAGRTDNPDAAREAITRMFNGLGESASVQVSSRALDDDASTAELTYQWSMGPGRDFSYDTSATVIELDDGWRIQWAPSVLHRDLRDGLRFQFSQDRDLQTPVIDRDGQPLMTWQPIGVVSLARAELASADVLAPLLTQFAPTITPESIRAQFDSMPGDALAVIRLREPDLAVVADQLATIPGVTVSDQGALLTSNREVSSPAIDGLAQFWQEWITRTEGWSVLLVDDQGAPAHELTSTPPVATEPVRTTLDLRMQLLAQQAVDRETRPAVLVAIAPSTGGILAVAQNAAANAQGPIAFSGLYPPGSTFKTITTAAAMEAGLVDPGTPVACPARATIENRTIPNDDDFELGTVPMVMAYARSCNTTMGALADQLPPDALTETARQFGLGVDYVVAGLTTVTGRVPQADTAAQRVENGIGQGTVTASPFGMAVVEASLAHGATILPSLIIGADATTSDSPSAQLAPDIVEGLRTMMRQTVIDGTATALNDIADLGGKTGTAEVGADTPAHGWFAGIVGDIAFATLVEGGDSSAPAVAVSGDFLRPVLAG